MSKSLRLSERWFRRGLWLVAVVFAVFLIGLGGAVVGDLPRVEAVQTLDDFLYPAAVAPLRATLRDTERAAETAQAAREQAELKQRAARGATQAVRDTFNNWLATRSVTQQSDQDPEVLRRTRELDTLRAIERSAEDAVQRQSQALLDAQQARDGAARELARLEQDGQQRLAAAQRAQELRVFGYRLALTLPLLAVAGWLFAKQRRSTWWPFVWGFIFFALFAFFVELVPYLPSYGGYVRYLVGIVITVVVGRQAILALNRYLERQKAAEARPDLQRREALAYDTALARLGKGVCPGCERTVDLKNTAIDFCPHCGIGLYDHCRACDARKNAFARFCHACGTGAQAAPHDAARPAVPGEALGATATGDGVAPG